MTEQEHQVLLEIWAALDHITELEGKRKALRLDIRSAWDNVKMLRAQLADNKQQLMAELSQTKGENDREA